MVRIVQKAADSNSRRGPAGAGCAAGDLRQAFRQRQSADAAINAVVERYIEEKRKAVIALESASSQLAKAVQEKGNADAAKAAADQKLTELQKSIETAIDNGWVTQDARTDCAEDVTEQTMV